MEEKNSEENRIVNRIALRKALKQLPEAHYDAYLYVEILGFTTREAGRILSVDQKTVVRRNDAAKASLKIFLSHCASK